MTISFDPLRRRAMNLLLAALALLPATGAYAWNAAGHRITASIAWQEMSPATRERVATLLAQHPGHSSWIQALKRGKNPPPATAAGLFAESSTWADDIRRDERYRDSVSNDSDTAARHRDWHFVNWPIDQGRAGDHGGQLDQQLLRLSRQLADPRRPDHEKSTDLVWLVHLVGDAHQPLHVASFPRTDGSQDPGGLGFAVRDPNRPRFSDVSLHVWWDDLPGPPWLRGDALAGRSAALLDLHPADSVIHKSSADWLDESLALARHSVLPGSGTEGYPEPDHPWVVNDAYRSQAIAIANRRLVEAGVRLGRLLDELLAGNKKVQESDVGARAAKR